jgi:phenylpropionate dioxygenase-like ring-hydroxylating dioxygenase large terminal subunit
MKSTRQLPLIPKSWFYVEPAGCVTKKPKAMTVGGIDIVLFRNDDGEVVALQRRCPHMNADLALGSVVNNQLQCSLHHFKFDKKGECKAHLEIRAQSYPVVERNGHIFFFNDPVAKFELPFFHGVEAREFEATSARIIHTENEWFVGAANAFDLVHFETVHLRRLQKAPVVSTPNAHSYRIELDYEIKGNSFSDRLMKTFYGTKASLDFTVYGGNFILAVTTVKGLKNYMMIVNAPDGKGKSIAHLMILAKKSNNPLKLFKRHIQAKFSQKFFQDEADSSRGVFIDNKTLVASDRVMSDYLKWLMNYYS